MARVRKIFLGPRPPSAAGLNAAAGSRGLKILALLFAAVASLAAQPAGIPDAETLLPPTAQRLAAIHAAAQRDGWKAHIVPLRATATRAYEAGKFPAAEAWLHVSRWAALFALPENEFLPRWIAAVNAAHVGHENMPANFTPRKQALGATLTPELQGWLVGSAAFSAEFFGLVAPVDYLPAVFQTLNELHRKNPSQFKTYANLALAIAVVHDVPPPSVWPHGQVTPEALPRKWPASAEAFSWWIRQEQLGRTYHKLSRLGAGELKFVVDAAAPFSELEWAQKNVAQPLDRLAQAYTMVRYRNDRVTGRAPIWPDGSYKLPEILAAGGICSDQAYFATQAGKARGVPTLLIYGAGNDGRHAWFGFLDAQRKWQLDAGRYAEQQFVTGFVRDPQTWQEFSDHELKFLSERFRELPSFKQSRVHAMFAAEYLAQDNAAAAAGAARKAVTFERRNQEGWEALIAATRADKKDTRAVENVMREAALAFQRYPDLEAAYVNRVAESLRARGQRSEAEAEIRRIALKNKSERGDLSVQQAREILVRAVTTQPVPAQIRTYNSVVDSYGRGAGIGFFDQVVVSFAGHLLQQQQKTEALKAVERARRSLRVEPNSQLEQEFAELLHAVRQAK